MKRRYFPLVLVLTALQTYGVQPGAAPSPSATIPILDVESGYLLGGSRGGKWIDPKAAATSMKSGTSYRVFNVTRALGKAKATPPKSEDAPCPDTLFTRITPNFASQNAQFALGGDHNPFPGPCAPKTPTKRFIGV